MSIRLTLVNTVVKASAADRRQKVRLLGGRGVQGGRALLVALFPSRPTHFFSSMKLWAVSELGLSSLIWLISSTVKFISRASSEGRRRIHGNSAFTRDFCQITKRNLVATCPTEAQVIRHDGHP